MLTVLVSIISNSQVLLLKNNFANAKQSKSDLHFCSKKY